ncbi:MAG: TIGR01777 family oxidoreductase [Bacteroidota bacterium]
MRILITGATGLVGSEIVRLCHTRGIAINYLTTRKDKIQKSDDFRGFLWNPAKDEIDPACFKGVGAIINLAGASISKRWTASYKKEILASRVDSLRTLYRALKQTNSTEIQSFVSASAIGIYPSSQTQYYSENEEGMDTSFLGEVVYKWEKEIAVFQSFDMAVAQIRVGLVMSGQGGALPEIAKPVGNYMGAALGTGQQWQSWIHCTDLARMFLFIVENGLQGTYNGVGPNPVTNSKLVREIAKVMERPLFLPNIPKFAIRLLLGEMAYLLFASQRVSSKKIEEEGFVFNFRNICRTLEHIYGEETPKSTQTVIQKEFLS